MHMENYIIWSIEMLGIILCIHELYGKKFHLNIQAVVLIVVDWIILDFVKSGKAFTGISVLVYVIVIIYCIVEFGFNIKELVVNNILYIILVSTLQLVAWSIIRISDIVTILVVDNVMTTMYYLIVNLSCLVIIVFVFPHIKLHKFSIFMQQKIALVRTVLFVCGTIAVYILVVIKTTHIYDLEQCLIVMVSLFTLFSVTYMWQKNQYKVKEQQIELQMHHMYEESFQNLISDIRSRQHDFENHINAVYSQHYTSTTLEELIEKQRKYCDVLREDNKYNKLLSAGNSIITGFLYGKFLQAEGKGITVKYNVKLGELECPVPTYKLVEIIGNLFDNAMEALEGNGCEKMIFLDLVQTSEELNFTIKNENPYIPQEKLLQLFQRGESSKGSQRGLGLSNVKKICEEYHCELLAGNKKDDGKTYIEFGIRWRKNYGKKRTHTGRQ